MIKPIETYYNGYRFRSRAEARWAVFFDSLDMQYMYEPEGFELSDGTKYLPDFYLPESKTFFEVKGLMRDNDYCKIKKFQEDLNVPVVIGYSDMTFQASYLNGERYVITENEDDSYLFQCRLCRKYSFGVIGHFRCCAIHKYEIVASGYNGGDDILVLQEDDLDFINPFYAAKQARFEFSKSGKGGSGKYSYIDAIDELISPQDYYLAEMRLKFL